MMNVLTIVILALSVVLFLYLTATLLFPEKF
jgi:K+-transporting ATPase KdpF subunit